MKNTIYRFFLICLPILLMSFLAASNAPLVNTYATFNCGSGQTSRCYGYDEQDINNLLGAQTSLVTVPLSHSGNSNLVGNTLWFGDSSTNASSCAYKNCWIEIGEAAKNVHSSLGTYAYWADNRPQIAACLFRLCQYTEHPMSTLHNFGSTMFLSIYYVSPGTWQVRATGAANFSQQSTNNVMVPDNFQFGAELGGSGTAGTNATMPTSTFYANQYLVAGSKTWRYVTSIGFASWDDGLPNNPPWAGWHVNPSVGTGGVWYTCIKTSAWNGSQYPNPC